VDQYRARVAVAATLFYNSAGDWTLNSAGACLEARNGPALRHRWRFQVDLSGTSQGARDDKRPQNDWPAADSARGSP